MLFKRMYVMDKKTIPLSVLDEFTPNTVGQDILRYVSLPDFLGTEKDTLLYYFGKNLGRLMEITTIDDIYYVFNKLQWGHLELIKDKRNHMIFHLMSDEVVHRIKSSITTDFRMESGFLAESIFKLTTRPCECTEKINEKLFRIEFKLFFVD